MPTKKQTCEKCGKKLYVDCFKGMDNYFGCGKTGLKVRNCPSLRGQDMGSGQALVSGLKRLRRRITSMLSALGLSKRFSRCGD